MYNIIPCQPRKRCRRWRICEPCSKIRQSKIASIAELGSLRGRNLSYAVIKPTTTTHLNQDKSNLIKQLAKQKTSGIWTVEEGSDWGTLHINLLTSSQIQTPAEYFINAWNDAGGKEAEAWAADVKHSDVRHIAAYISKQEQHPDKSSYSARIYGSFGNWKRPLDALAGGNHGVATAAALEHQLKDITTDAHHIQAPHAAERDKHLARVLAGARGDIIAKGYIYLSGYGIKNIKDLHDAGVITAKEYQDLL